MPSLSHSSWHRAWYPVAYLKDLRPDRPTPFTLLGDDLVIWRDRQASQWRAFADVCPHRLVPLSQGRLNGRGELECPYHGWSFDGEGHCTIIPQAEAGSTIDTPRSRCHAYATAEGQGMLFVFAGDPAAAAAAPLPLLPMLAEEPEQWTVQDTFRDLPYDALTLLENVLDVSHVPFTHHATVGKRETAGPVNLELTSSGPEGFTGVWPEGPRRGTLGTQFTTFQAPCLMWHDLTAKGFARILTVVYATPIRPGECRLFARFPFRFESALPRRLLKLRPEWLQHLANHVVLEDDQAFLHWQERVLEARGGSDGLARSCYLATSSDAYVRALHDWISAGAGKPFGDATLPERLGETPLLERYESHTRHCRSCSGADRRLAQLQPMLAAVLLLALGGAAWWGASAAAAGALGVAVLAAAAWFQAGRWRRQLRHGRPVPPRNLT
ncbi:Rieske 2Fe-2S domain-containing protein [Synechococcus sp. CS-1324]|uniref:aromatic ring-hydroxylating dioxygenase subunit alpha n=1 Tax=unclassified Synechococcus TaxID=2626047 RepID=UPI000DB36BB7|nr:MULTISPECIES: Rieske 2Fe-2S domain-containing protein [unclassified Synechococcus]MCT0213941.1 Rieske 2Fe-2S domain-containing protein [Synechococcus sp. CS-1326]MCT0230843.1 Rieske 2Fe-2S domain-containing protein [Synechococcus sp. CS-1324]MCT0233517.1 Rieske 2Fe-2S domain-containing protein [Synechococcus sp. CS-1327]PZV03381.1 MAG: cell death suppressor protein Lls1 [Cyanobium sp.]